MHSSSCMADRIAPLACLCTCRCTHDFTQPSCVSLLIKVKGRDEMLFFFFFFLSLCMFPIVLEKPATMLLPCSFTSKMHPPRVSLSFQLNFLRHRCLCNGTGHPKKTVAPQPLCELAFAKAAHGTDFLMQIWRSVASERNLIHVPLVTDKYPMRV